MTQSGKSIFLSYAHKADTSLVDRLLGCESNEANFFQSAQGEDENGEKIIVRANIKVDTQELDFGHSIQGFMNEIAASKHLILMISDEYLRSPFCMYECLSAYNQIENAFYPAIVFIKNELDSDTAILIFEDGIPRIHTNKLKKYWQEQLESAVEDTAKRWQQRNIDMATELESWLIGSRSTGAPDKILAIYDPTEVTSEDQVTGYIKWALNPLTNKYSCPSSDRLRAQSITQISNLLKKNWKLTKALNRGDELENDEARCVFVEQILRDGGAEFVKRTLSVALEHEVMNQSNKQHLGSFRKSTDEVFGELVKFGVRVETLHHQLQEMNQKNGNTAYAVATESMLPEMVTAFIQKRLAAFQKIDFGDEHIYVGEREYILDSENPLEFDEMKEDALELLNTPFANKAYDLIHADYDTCGRQKSAQRKPGSEVRNSLVTDELKKDKTHKFIIKIEGMSQPDACKLAKKLNANNLLKNVPVFFTANGTGNEIKMAAPWYTAIDAYYKARENPDE